MKYIALIGFSLALLGCLKSEPSPVPPSVVEADCKKWVDEMSCEADPACGWKVATADKPAKCKAK